MFTRVSEAPKYVEHVRVSPQCGLCLQRLLDKEPTVIRMSPPASRLGGRGHYLRSVHPSLMLPVIYIR